MTLSYNIVTIFMVLLQGWKGSWEFLFFHYRYYSLTIIEIACALALTCWVLRFHHYNTSVGKVPNWVRVWTLTTCAVVVKFVVDFKLEICCDCFEPFSFYRTKVPNQKQCQILFRKLLKIFIDSRRVHLSSTQWGPLDKRVRPVFSFGIKISETDLDRVNGFKLSILESLWTIGNTIFERSANVMGKKISSKLGILHRVRKVLPTSSFFTLNNTIPCHG